MSSFGGSEQDNSVLENCFQWGHCTMLDHCYEQEEKGKKINEWINENNRKWRKKNSLNDLINETEFKESVKAVQRHHH